MLLDSNTLDACLAEINRWIKRGPLEDHWENEQRNGMILAYNLVAQLKADQDALVANVPGLLGKVSG